MTRSSSVKALVLAAGLGTRLRPLTERLPKPLFPFFGPSLLGLALWRLHSQGHLRVAVNTHHLADQVADHLRQYVGFFEELKISHEPALLGTGGALIPLSTWLGEDNVLIYNGDTISTVDLAALIDSHLSSGASATMVLLPHHEQGKNPVWTKDDRIIAIGGHEDAVAATFTGIHIVSPRLRKRLPKSVMFHHIIDAYQEALREGEFIGAFWHHGLWADLGTPRDYWQSLVNFASSYTPENDSALGLTACNKWLGEPFSFSFKTKSPGILPPVTKPRGEIPRRTIVGPYAFLSDLPNETTMGSIANCALLGTFPKSGIDDAPGPRLILDDLVVEVPV